MVEIPKGRLGVVCNDAGGAEILSSYLLETQKKAKLSLQGPAIKIFARKLANFENLELSTLLNHSDWVLTGTGWQSDFEWEAIRKAKQSKLITITFLDHWYNYKSRFERRGRVILPDRIWVGDPIAVSIAQKVFPEQKVELVENPYVKHFLQNLGREENLIKSADYIAETALFVCENINIKNFHQNDAIRYFFKNFVNVYPNIKKVIVRPHPSESCQKYYWATKEFNKIVEVSDERTLEYDMARSTIVAGCGSMAMALGVFAGRRVISCIPNQIIPNVLPFEEVEQLHNISLNK